MRKVLSFLGEVLLSIKGVGHGMYISVWMWAKMYFLFSSLAQVSSFPLMKEIQIMSSGARPTHNTQEEIEEM